MSLPAVLMIPDLIGAAQGYFVAFILFRLKRGNHQANSLLAAMVLVVSVILSFSPILIPSVYTAFPFLIRIAEPMRLLIAPLLFLYVTAQTGGIVNRRSLVHFVPFVVYVVFLMATFYFQPAEEKIKFLTENLAGKSQWYNVFLLARSLHFFTYLIFSLRLLRTYSRSIRNEYSSIERINLHWLRNLVAAMWLWWAIQLVVHIGMLLGFPGLRSLNIIVGLLGTLWMYLLAYIAIMKADTFVHVSSPQELSAQALSAQEVFVQELSAQESAAQKQSVPLAANGVFTGVVAHNGVLASERRTAEIGALREEPQEGIALREHLQHFMEQQKPYLDSQLTLQKLATLSDIPAYRISDILNKHIGVNFFDFVNRYRVEEWKRQIIDASSSTTIQEVAFQSGFNSKSSFNAAFKKHTGQTPSEYRTQYTDSFS